MARAAGVSVSRVLMDAALNPPKGLVGPKRQQADAGTSRFGMNMQDCVRYLFGARVDEMVRSQRVDEIKTLFGRLLDDPLRTAQLRQWIRVRAEK